MNTITCNLNPKCKGFRHDIQCLMLQSRLLRGVIGDLEQDYGETKETKTLQEIKDCIDVLVGRVGKEVDHKSK